jgi:hypothetical protein
MGNCQIVTKVKKVKKLVEKCIPMLATEEKGWKFAEYPDIQVHKIVTKELGHNNRVDKPGLIIK